MTTEEIVYQGVQDRELEIDANGQIWRVASREGCESS